MVPQQGDVDVARGDVDVAEEQTPVLRYGEEQIAVVGPEGEVQIEAGGVHAAGEVEPIAQPIPIHRFPCLPLLSLFHQQLHSQ